ncbi:MAG: PilZ domain-containing protein [Planctomycetes bacterium]|nr:PilZ domain-containing protein [Planctomycetota bacterium]
MSQLDDCPDPVTLGYDAFGDENSRYYCNNPEAIRVLVRVKGQNSATLEARLVDISSRGTKLLLETSLPQGEQVTLLLQAAAVKLSIPVVVRWCQLSLGEQWYVGCEFTPTLDEASLTDLAEAGHLERRRSPRLDADVFTTARWELSEMPHAVLIKNISTGGFCVVCPWPVPKNSLLKIEPENQDILIIGKACWQRKLARGYLVGCTLTKDIDFFVLRDLIYRLQKEKEDAGLDCANGSIYQQMGAAALKEAQWSKAERYFQLALEIQYSHLGDALNSADTVCTLARIWKESNSTNIAGAVAQTLEIDIWDAGLLLSKALADDPCAVIPDNSQSAQSDSAGVLSQ